MDENLVFISTEESEDRWFHHKYFAGASNARYFTFQLALGLLNQRHPEPTIIETGCQRELDDLGAGMSTSIFAEYVERYGGKLITVDNNREHLQRAMGYLEAFPKAKVSLIEADSGDFLTQYTGPCDLLYLDSLDYPLDAEEKPEEAVQAQQHNLKEFLVVEDRLPDNVVLLLDDNLLPGGGKPKLLKTCLIQKGWTCLLDYQQSVWVKEL
jgi:hypothetical protein